MFVVLVCIVGFFFFKQKTAYEMRISDWSSDVCSSDLGAGAGGGKRRPADPRRSAFFRARPRDRGPRPRAGRRGDDGYRGLLDATRPCRSGLLVPVGRAARHADEPRSEEHTSELQSLMRTSYAVFCLTKERQQNSHSPIK